MSARVPFRSAATVGLLALAIGVPQPTEASRLIQNTASGRVTAGDRVRCGDPGGFVHWTKKTTSWFHNTAGQGAGKDSPLKKAMGSWGTVELASHHLSYSGTTTAGFVTDGQNTIGWATGQGCSGTCLALTALVLQQPGQVIVEADITFNSARTWTNDGTDFDTQAVATHELGHALGLHHTELDDAPLPTMNSFYFGPDGRSVEGDDRLALQCSQEYFSPTPLGVYQKRNDGSIWGYTGQPCAGGECPGWAQFDNYPQTASIVADGENLFQRHLDGSIWRFKGRPCFGSLCGSGWEKVDNNSQTKDIVASGGTLYQLHYDGSIWRFTGAVCSGNSCPGWELLRGAIPDFVMSLVADGDQLYMLQFDGSMWRFTGAACGPNGCGGWQLIDNNFSSIRIAAGGGQLYQLHLTGAIFRFTGQTCSAGSCPGWQLIDNDPLTMAIAATRNNLYMLRTDGYIWRHTGTPCGSSGCPGWQVVDKNPKTESITANGGQLYQLHDDGRVWRFTGQACTATACPGWQLTDEGSGTMSIAVGR